MEEEKTSIRDEIKELKDIVSESSKKKVKQPKKFRLPFKAKVNNANARKGYVTVEVLNENKNIEFTREPIVDGTIKLGDTFHAVDELDIYFYKGKPFIHQPKGSMNSYNPHTRVTPLGENTTYGQKYIMARMEGDKITGKKKIGGLGMSIGALIIGGIIIYALFTGGA